jgi:hypothetical protein
MKHRTHEKTAGGSSRVERPSILGSFSGWAAANQGYPQKIIRADGASTSRFHAAFF